MHDSVLLNSRILVIEDEKNLLDLIVFNLESEGCDCFTAISGNQAINALKKNSFDLILLDVMLPEKNGFEIMQFVQQSNIKTPVIFMTARSQDNDKIYGLKSGAVDYITKPFNLEELILRVKIHARKTEAKSLPAKIMIGDYEVNSETFEVLHRNKIVAEIGKKEMQLLSLLAENEGKVVSRDMILEKIWGSESETTTRTIDNYILTLRKIFHDDPKNPQFFHSIRGVGYKLNRQK